MDDIPICAPGEGGVGNSGLRTSSGLVELDESVYKDNKYYHLLLDIYIPTADVRLRPTFAKLDRESGKWRDLAETFMDDVCRDADFITITDMYYIMAPQLSDKVRYVPNVPIVIYYN